MKTAKQIILLVFLFFLSLQGWRGAFSNSWHIAKGYIQLKDLKASEAMLFAQNQKMLAEIKAFKQNPQLAALKGSQEFNLVQDPEQEIIVNFSD